MKRLPVNCELDRCSVDWHGGATEGLPSCEDIDTLEPCMKYCQLCTSGYTNQRRRA